jgi:tRNA pseudouridine38-40 synthase
MAEVLLNQEQIKEILDAKERTEAGVTAPPQGLTLVGIEYSGHVERGQSIWRRNTSPEREKNGKNLF